MAEIMGIDDIRRLTHERIAAESAEHAQDDTSSPQRKSDSGDEPPLDFVEKCLDGNEIGDSLLYNRLHRGKFVNNVIQKNGWMQFDGRIWRQDYHLRAKSAVEEVAKQYLRLLQQIELDIKEFKDDEEKKWLVPSLQNKKKLLLTRVNKLRTDKGRVSVLSCAISNADPLTVTPDMFDKNPWLFPCANGIIDLRTGNFVPSKPEHYITRSSPIIWKGIDEPCPRWDAFTLEILGGNVEVVDYLHRVLGYTATALKSERIFVVFHGPHGQNGKGLMMDVLAHIFGEMAGPMQTEMLMSQKFVKASSGPSPDIMALKGLRLVWASETERKNSFAAGKVKYFSGGDPLIGRNLQDRDQTTFEPTHVMFLLTNNLPYAPPEDSAFWTRMKRFLFSLSYVENPTEPYQRKANLNLFEELREESSGILARIVRGCLEWQRIGMATPQAIIDDTISYREHEDDLQDFLDECCIINKDDNSTENRTTANDLYRRFKVWWQDRNAYKPMPQKEFSDKLQLKGFLKIKSDKIFYQYIKLQFTGDQSPDGGGFYG